MELAVGEWVKDSNGILGEIENGGGFFSDREIRLFNILDNFF